MEEAVVEENLRSQVRGVSRLWRSVEDFKDSRQVWNMKGWWSG